MGLGEEEDFTRGFAKHYLACCSNISLPLPPPPSNNKYVFPSFSEHLEKVLGVSSVGVFRVHLISLDDR